MIEWIEIGNFKSYQRAKLPLARVTFLLGANGSGKSNALEAIRFLHWMGRGERLDDLESRMGTVAGQVRGGIDDCFRFGETEFWFRVGASNGRKYTFFQKIVSTERLETGISGRFAIGNEYCETEGEERPLYAMRPNPGSVYSDEVAVECNNFAQGGNKPLLPCSNRQSIFLQLQSPSRFDRPMAKERIPEAAVFLKNTLGRMVFLDPALAKMRGYARRTQERTLERDASNVSAVLYNLCQDTTSKETLLGIVRSLPEQDIRDITFVETSLGDVMLQLKEGGGHGREIPATLLSDGTLRVLAFAACILGMPSGTLGVIEEVDNGIHPSRLRHLVDKMFEVAEARDIQLLATTHNPALMSSIPLREIQNVLCCFRNGDNGTSNIRRLGELPRYFELVSRGELGDLARYDLLNRFMHDNPSPDDTARRNREWADQFFSNDLEGKG